MTTPFDRDSSRRKFLAYLAASPLAAAGAADGFAQGAVIGATAPPVPKPADPVMWAPLDANQMIANPKQAINVFDFEPVMRKNVPPAHFGYMASGIDDEVTLRANREGFQKFQLRPRRLVDVSKVDMKMTLFGNTYDSPIICAPVGGQKSWHADGESAVAKACKQGNHLQILSTVTSTSVEDIRADRDGPVWMQLYATNKWEVAENIIRRAEKAGCTALAVTVDRNGGRNQETLLRLQKTDTRDCSSCHDRTNLTTQTRTRPMYNVTDLTGLTNTQSSAMTWETIKRMRGITKMKIVLKGILAHEDATLAVKNGIDGIIVSNHGARSEDSGRSTIDALPEILKAVDGKIPVLVDSGFRRGSDIVKALAMGATGVCVGRPYIWGLGAFGQPGVERVLELLRLETRGMMQQVGAPSLKDLKPAIVRRA
jgi:4-hydroxymandelate oxidase